MNNFYDGMLTILGILLGYFMLIIYTPEMHFIDSKLVILPSLGVSISMFMSGVSGSYLSERAEQKKEKRELNKAMVIFEDEKLEETNSQNDLSLYEEIQKAMVTPIKINDSLKKKEFEKSIKKKARRKRTIHEKAEIFTSIIVSFTNGTAPLLGGIVPLIPFFFIKNAVIPTFLISFLTIFICIVFLGIVLGMISKESIIKNIFEMTVAFIVTLLVSFLLLRV